MDTTEQKLPTATGTNPARTKRRRHRSSKWRKLRRLMKKIRWGLVAVVVVVIAIILTMTALILVTDATAELDQSRSTFERSVDVFGNKSANEWTYSDYERLTRSLSDLLLSIDHAQSRTSFLRPVARLDADLETQFAILDASEQLGTAMMNMLVGMQPTVFFLTEGQDDATLSQISSGERVVELLLLGRNNFSTAQTYLANFDREIDEVDQSQISTDLFLLIQDLKEYRSQIADINTVFLNGSTYLTSMLGLDSPKTYLILSQNSDELRPSGGYISTYGWMTVRNGRIVDYDYQPTTAETPSRPTLAIPDEFAIPQWWIPTGDPITLLWDGSWSPSYPMTAEMAAWYYDNGFNPNSPVDGVIAIDTVGFEYMLEAIGTVEVEGYPNTTISGSNFRDTIYQIRTSGEGDTPHKRFLAAVYRSIMTSWQNVPVDRKDEVLGAQLRALREQHLMVYFKDDALNQSIAPFGWSGQQEAALNHDYLMVVDANVTPNKSNRSVIRQITYDVTIETNGTLNNRVTISYDYSDILAKNDPAVSEGNGLIDRYYNRLQVFIPHASTLTDLESMPGGTESFETDTHTEITSFVIVEYNAGERYQFSFTTPVLVEEFGPYRRYRLLLQKQPGTINDTVNVQVRLPVGAKIVETSPSPVASFVLEQQVLEFRADLTRSQWIEIVYQQ
ncbi:MAG: DUF4012 domain-containing protein [Anaerolineales bacterium]|nr:DUF4012 domain-containing protein [Anaerolineales bacterium]